MLDLGELQSQVQAIGNGDETARREAINALKVHKEPEWADVPNKVINTLVDSLRNQIQHGTKQRSVRQDAVAILGNIGARSEPAIPLLTELLQQSSTDSIQDAAASALGKIGKAAKVAVEHLCALLTNHRPSLVIQAIRAISEIGSADQKTKAALLKLWQPTSSDQKVQIQLATALSKLKIDAPGLLKYLTATLVASQDTSLRKAAAEALGWCNKNEVNVAPALLTAALRDRDEGVCQVAEDALVRLHLTHDKAIALCAKQLKESPYAEAALRHSGQAAVVALIEALKADEAETREKVARTLGSIGEVAVDAIPGLTAALRDKDLAVRLAVAKSLWNISKKADPVIPVFIDLLNEKWASQFETAETRRRFLQAVMESLGRIGPPAKAAIPALTHRTKDSNRLISESAQSAIKDISAATPASPTTATGSPRH